MKRKRSSNWDQPAGGLAIGASEGGSTAEQMQRQQTQQMLMQQMMMANNNGGKKTRELYVGNLAIGMVSEQMIREFFNTAMAGLAPECATMPAIANVWMASDNKYSFVEFRTPELATTAMSLDKVELCGRSLHVGRPSGYVPPMNHGMGDQMSMNLGSGVGNVGGLATAMGMGAGMEGAMEMAMVAQGPPPTEVLVLVNMLSAEELATDEYDDIVNDIKEECSQFGTVVDTYVPRPSKDGLEVQCVGKAYVRFSEISAAEKAFDALAGRTFDGKKVACTYLEVDKYEARELEPPSPPPIF